MTTLVQLRTRVPAAEVAKRAGSMPTEGEIDLLLHGDTDVYAPNGDPVVFLRRGALDPKLAAAAYPALHSLRTAKTTNRGKYSGKPRLEKEFADGYKSKNTHTEPVASAIIGFYDRQGGRFPFCRATAFTADQVEAWATVVPLVANIGELMRRDCPDRHARQMAHIAKVRPEYVVHHKGERTPFTTLTVNNNVAPAGIHTDRGDFKEGIGVITMLRRGAWSGGWLVFPEFRVAVDLHDRDLIYFNPHLWHGVTEMRKESDDAERLTCVYYCRSKMADCRSPAEELANAKHVRGTIPRG